ncbi:hypothetical protein KKH16_02415 [Patescibacteria group bacterium]|nr:hypothetical protein [Patescibacteria group bacterium]MBU1870993.1 hypothetical protein [Patescibacteria group bacterium]
MVEKFSPQETKSKEIITVVNPRELFITLTGLKKKKIEEMGYVITETQQNIIEEKWSGVSVKKSYDWLVKLTKDGKELVLKGLADHRFNSGSEPIEITVEKNEFSKEELENFSQI